ncbi:MAG: hypothetical protein GX358_05195 [candidate division WS1 bacterium]|nr:hypothetical protein [candidate division WS1 bacterium]
MWKLVAVGVLILALMLAVVALSGCPKPKSGEQIQEERGGATAPPPPPPPPPGYTPSEGSGYGEAAPPPPPAPAGN